MLLQGQITPVTQLLRIDVNPNYRAVNLQYVGAQERILTVPFSTRLYPTTS